MFEMPYLRRKTAWQHFNRSDYDYLKNWLNWRIDRWIRQKCISFGMATLLRHARGRTELEDDGTLAIWEICDYQGMRTMSVEPDEVLGIANQTHGEQQNKQRFETVDKRSALQVTFALAVAKGTAAEPPR